ncbi:MULTISPECIES: hypothetical protein [unclassified Cellulophaga]|uniref:hypothetical protein n=1 Tax=unclassified Cellulophaga TaxID=2634405 RepID=UPI0026E409B7|nr:MULTISPECIES: hypothetical protein [unclassified Cellulophaga]MDO6489898.1 hypothetical protein [Cellulophaga sp. 2_MG-2023]MDO6494908.1 hypothetical protein [Cellulophaga sp. 3_MG-2023]
MKFFKKHIALFFCLLFLVSQASYVFHTYLEPHNHTHTNNTLEFSTVDFTPLAVETAEFSTAIYDCLLCHQFKLTKVIIAYENKLKVKEPIATHYLKIEYVEPYTFFYLLSNSSLRAPPTVSLAA